MNDEAQEGTIEPPLVQYFVEIWTVAYIVSFFKGANYKIMAGIQRWVKKYRLKDITRVTVNYFSLYSFL